MPPASTTTTTRPVAALPRPSASVGATLLVPGRDGLDVVELIGADPQRRRIVTDEVRAAADDLAGGVVFETGERTAGLAGAIYRVRAGATAPELVLAQESGWVPHLVGVERFGGVPTIFVIRDRPGPLQRSRSEPSQLVAIDLQTGAWRVVISDLSGRVHLGPELIGLARDRYDPEGSLVWNEFVGVGGPVVFAANPAPVPTACSPTCPMLWALSSTDRRALIGQALVDLDTGAELLRSPLLGGEINLAGDLVAAVEFDLPPKPERWRQTVRRLDALDEAPVVVGEGPNNGRSELSRPPSFARTRIDVAEPVAVTAPAVRFEPVIVVERDRVVRVEPDRAEVVVEGPTLAAVGDGRGGLLYTPRADPPQILHRRAGAAGAAVVADNAAVVDAGLVGGALHVLFFRDGNLGVLRTDDGTSQVVAETGGARHIHGSLGGGIVAVERVFAGGPSQSALEFVDLRGAPLRFAGDPKPQRCSPLSPGCAQSVRLNRDGSRVAYQDGDVARIVVRDLATGAVEHRLDLAGQGFPTDLDDRFVLVIHLPVTDDGGAALDLWSLADPTRPVRRLSTHAISAHFA